MANSSATPRLVDKTIISVATLLAESALTIPSYQRPYKWSQKNLNALLTDIHFFKNKPAYRLGTVVLHDDGDEEKEGGLNIVDGQQRTLTLMLLVKAIIEKNKIEKEQWIQAKDLAIQLTELEVSLNAFMQRQAFSSDVSQYHLQQNYLAAQRFLARDTLTEMEVDFLLNRCEVVVFILKNISEAFQFFDSQNARGRDLAPHDLLKAYHLREFPEAEQLLQAQAVQQWERLDSNHLSPLFANYLYPIRSWAEGESALYFNKDKVDHFKGASIQGADSYPYKKSLEMLHYFTDDYNKHFHRCIDKQQKKYPFQLDQIIINGRRFFEMIDHYQQLVEQVLSGLKEVSLVQRSRAVMDTLDSYEARSRTGDQYIRRLFDCAVIFYIDKFGTSELELSNAIEKLFIWAYSCRLSNYSVHLTTINNHALQHNVFKAMKKAIHPAEVWELCQIDGLVSDNKGTRLDEVRGQFNELGYGYE